MLQKPVFKPSYHIETVDSEGVFLLSEQGYFVLRGGLYCRLAPLLDGRHTVDDIVDELVGEGRAAEVYYALMLLEKKGYLVEAQRAVSPARAAFWHALGVDALQADGRLREATVSLAQFGAVPAESFASNLSELGIRVGEDGGFAVALADDYLQDGLAEFNAAALATGRTWLLVKPQGTVLWIGPVFRPGETACWECLAQRLRVNRAVEAYLQQRKAIATPFPIARAALPTTVRAALNLAATATASAIACSTQIALENVLITLDVLTLSTQKHTIVRRPQCRSCGEPAYRDREPVPVMLQSREKRYTADGGHRAVTPEETFAQYERHVSHLTGAVTVLTRVPADEARSMHVYVAGHNLAMQHDNLYFLRQGLRSVSGGKGMTDAQARASGLCEALERYSGNFHGDEIRNQTSYRRLGASAIHPNACMLFSQAQQERRYEWDNHVLVPFDEEAEIEWTPVWSLTAQTLKYLPTGYLYYGYPMSRNSCSFWADSNGNAAGNTLEEAILQGFMELVERDSVCLWWYNRLRRPAVDLDSFDEPYIRELWQLYRRLNRDVWVLDLTSDLGIPVFAAISRRTDSSKETIMLGFGAHFDPRIGLLRAVTELNQCTVLASGLDESAEAAHADPALRDWLTTAKLANHPYLVPDDIPPRKRSDYEVTWSNDLREDVLHCEAIVEKQGMEMLVLDQTRPDIKLPVVKVIVPGLRHIYPRFAPGRLYDAPVELGWLTEPLTEEQLNPVAFFF